MFPARKARIRAGIAVSGTDITKTRLLHSNAATSFLILEIKTDLLQCEGPDHPFEGIERVIRLEIGIEMIRVKETGADPGAFRGQQVDIPVADHDGAVPVQMILVDQVDQGIRGRLERKTVFPGDVTGKVRQQSVPPQKIQPVQPPCACKAG